MCESYPGAVPDKTFTTITLREYEPLLLPAEALSQVAGELLWRHYSHVVDVAFPSPRTEGQWQLTSQGWVGQIPLTPDVTLSLQPRFPLSNLFQMLAYAYRLRPFHFLEGLTGCQSVEGFFDLLARELADRTLARSRQGLHQAYFAEEGPLPYVRGQVDLSRQRPWDSHLNCRYETQTTDISDNQIIAWTLHQIAQSGFCLPQTYSQVQRACRSLDGAVTVTPVSVEACKGRYYNRLNEEYRLLHALCRFFLEQSGPTHRAGSRTMLPFLANMSRLYEQFVAEWLRQKLPAPWSLRAQEQMVANPAGSHEEDKPAALHFNIDLVLYQEDGQPRMILDTKYKNGITVSTADVSQVVTYAQLRGCQEAVLIYPVLPAHPLDVQIGNVRVRALPFTVDDDLEKSGAAFLETLAL